LVVVVLEIIPTSTLALELRPSPKASHIKANNSVAFNTFTIYSQNIFITQRKLKPPVTPLLPPLAANNMLSVSVDLPVQYISQT
jgi:hypothetical protein